SQGHFGCGGCLQLSLRSTKVLQGYIRTFVTSLVVLDGDDDKLVTCDICSRKYRSTIPFCPECNAKNPGFKEKHTAARVVFIVGLVLGVVAMGVVIYSVRPENGPSKLPESIANQETFVPYSVNGLLVSGSPTDPNYDVTFRIVDKALHDGRADGIA